MPIRIQVCRVRCTPGKDLLVRLGGDDALGGALRAAVGRQQGNPLAQLAQEAVRAGGPEEVVQLPRQLLGRLVLEEQVEVLADLVDACGSKTMA